MDTTTSHPARKPILKIIILGNSCVGKTTIADIFVHRRFCERHIATIGCDFLSKTVNVGGKSVHLQIWDTAGQERYRVMTQNIYRGVNCCVLVFNLTDRISFNDLETWRDNFLLKSNALNPMNFPFVVLANKLDLESERVISDAAIKKFCDKFNIPFFYASCKDTESIDVAFEKVAQLGYEQYLNEQSCLPDIDSMTMTIKLDDAVVPSTSWCSFF